MITGTISKQLSLLLSLVVFLTIIERDNVFVTGKPTTITYDLVEDVDGMPVLGRGYSLTTNSFLSSCFDVNGTTVEDSYHYDYYVTDITREDYRMLRGRIAQSFGYDEVKSTIHKNFNFNYISESLDSSTFQDLVNKCKIMLNLGGGGSISNSFSRPAKATAAYVDSGGYYQKSYNNYDDNDNLHYSETNRVPNDGEDYYRPPPIGGSGDGADSALNQCLDEQLQLTMQALLDSKHIFVATMRIDRSFSSLLEDDGNLSSDAIQMIQDEEYVNFFTTCGPNYVRSLKRAKEVTAIFTFDANDKYEAQLFADKLKLYVHGNRGNMMATKRQEGEVPIETELNGFDIDIDIDDEKIRQSLSIEMFGYGLGLNGSGSKTLVATSLDEFNEVMRFAFTAMTKSSDDHGSGEEQSGLVHSIEVIPWADNPAFLALAEVDFSRILVPMPRGYMESSEWALNDDGLYEKVCLTAGHITDDYGKCCDVDDLITVSYSGSSKSKKKGYPSEGKQCDSQYYISPVIMKDNLETNAEFVSWISAVARDKTKTLSNLGQCVNKLRSLPNRFDYFYLHSSNEAEYDDSIDMAYTVKELKAALDPASDLSILTLMSNENDEYFEMFYQPCLAALYGMNDGMGRNADPKYFMAKPWYNYEECARVSCLERNMAWDRLNGNGCVDGLLGRDSNDVPVPLDTDPHCAKDVNESTGEETCKYQFTPNANIVLQIDNCRDSLPHGEDGRGNPIPLSMGYLIDYFCMPQVAFDRDQADEEKMLQVDNSWHVCMTEVDETSPSNAPSSEPSMSPSSMHTESPTDVPSEFPSSSPTTSPTDVPSESLTSSPTMVPTNTPSESLTSSPTMVPTNTPSEFLSSSPTFTPTNTPTPSCNYITFTTSREQAADSPRGSFDIGGYGKLPPNCHDTLGSSCSLTLCDTDTLEITATSVDGWKFTITGDIGPLVQHTSSTSTGLHYQPFPTWMDTDQYDSYQKYLLKSSPSIDSCYTITFKTGSNDNDASSGPIEIKGYGRMPFTCHYTVGASCTMQICDTNTLEISTTSDDAWFFSIEGDIGEFISSEVAPEGTRIGTYSNPFPTALDSKAHDISQIYKLESSDSTDSPRKV